MNVLNKARVLIYRFHEKGLEIFLVNHNLETNPDIWKIPKVKNKTRLKNCIELNPTIDNNGDCISTIAVEGDWHDIPSIRGLIKQDLKIMKDTIKEVVPGIEKGAFIAVKEAIKHTMPDEYKAVKELKDILIDRQTVINI